MINIGTGLIEYTKIAVVNVNIWRNIVFHTHLSNIWHERYNLWKYDQHKIIVHQYMYKKNEWKDLTLSTILYININNIKHVKFSQCFSKLLFSFLTVSWWANPSFGLMQNLLCCTYPKASLTTKPKCKQLCT